MIDLHCHLLPAVDDGSRSVEQSVAVLRRMAEAGISEIALTPHLDASRIVDGPPALHDEAFARLLAAAPKEIRLHRGAEVMLDRALAHRAVEARRITLAGTRFVLVEFTRLVAASAAKTALGQVIKSGLIPVLAHPERYAACTPARVEQWRGIGAVIQVDANTLFQPTGRGNRARALVSAGLADILAADNHGDARSLAEPYARLTDAGAGDLAEKLMVENPAAILADRRPEPLEPYEVPVSLYQRLKGWIDEMGS